MFTVDKEKIIALRRELHEYPEVDFDLPKTVALIKRELDAIGVPYTKKYGDGSVVAYINSEKEGFTIALRADTDALKITEKTGLEFSSKNDGLMHACGHDAHTAILIGTAKTLKSLEDKINCRVKLLFQPSEEGMKSGAKMMVENGVLDDVDVILGLHVENSLKTGTLGVCKGPSQASSRHFQIDIFGKSAHAALPHTGIDALAAAVRVYNDIQLILSREINPFEKYLCSIGKLEAGTSHNVVADHAMIKGTIRTFNMDIDKFIIERIEKIVKNVTEEIGATYTIHAPLKSMCLDNNHRISDLLMESMRKAVGEQNVFDFPPKLSSEDFSLYLPHVPGVFFRLGTGNEEKGCTTNAHNNDFMIDEDSFEYGVRAFVQFVLDNMNGI